MMQGGVDIEQLPVFQIQQIGQPVGLFGGQFFDRGLLLVILGPEDGRNKQEQAHDDDSKGTFHLKIKLDIPTKVIISQRIISIFGKQNANSGFLRKNC